MTHYADADVKPCSLAHSRNRQFSVTSYRAVHFIIIIIIIICGDLSPCSAALVRLTLTNYIQHRDDAVMTSSAGRILSSPAECNTSSYQRDTMKLIKRSDQPYKISRFRRRKGRYPTLNHSLQAIIDSWKKIDHLFRTG